MKLVDRDDLILVLDPETGIMRDIMLNTNTTKDDYYGVYCFHDDITDLSYDFFGRVKNSTSDFRNWAQENLEDFSQNAQWFCEHFNWIKLSNLGASIGGMGLGTIIFLKGLGTSAIEDTAGRLKWQVEVLVWQSWNTFWESWDDPWYT